MSKIVSREALEEMRADYKNALTKQDKKVLICAGTGCVAGGSLEIYARIQELLKEKGLPFSVELEKEPHDHEIGVKKSGCHGFCEMGPLLRIEPEGLLYIKVKLEDCEEIVNETLVNGNIINRLVYKQDGKEYSVQGDVPFYKRQSRYVLGHCGQADAESIEEYIANGGYRAVAKALFEMEPEEICNELSEANLRGRGGGGFPAGKKLDQVRREKSEIKYVVCNGDEGDPGAFMDRSIMEGDPHRMLEGMIISAIATGATQGYIYVRAEYPLAVHRLRVAIEQANKYGLLGDDILGSGKCFNIKINRGAGAFVCGEGSALTASIEGKRGMPRVKPPRTVNKGLFEKPTALNNVETLATMPLVILSGADEFKKIGTENSPGTKAFALTGNVNNTGLIEVPMGTTLREIIFDIGGGVKGGKGFKAVQIGGPSGGCLTKEHLDLPLDFDSLKSVGAMIGSGGLVVMDEDTCMVEVARFFMNFTKNESCGKCVPCREGTKAMLDILQRIVDGHGKESDIDELLELADTISNTALCGLGKTAASPVISTIKYFKDEYLAHIIDKKCPTKTCANLRTIKIDPDQCKGCSLCSKICPVGAIEGKIKSPFVINQDKCIKCGTCIETCKFKAIVEV